MAIAVIAPSVAQDQKIGAQRSVIPSMERQEDQSPRSCCCCGCTTKRCASTAAVVVAIVAWYLLPLYAVVLGDIKFSHYQHFASKDVWALGILVDSTDSNEYAEQIWLTVKLEGWVANDSDGSRLVQEAAARYREIFPAIASIQLEHGKAPQFRDEEFDFIALKFPIVNSMLGNSHPTSAMRLGVFFGILVASDSSEEIQDLATKLEEKHREKLGALPIRVIRLGHGAAVHGRLPSTGGVGDETVTLRMLYKAARLRAKSSVVSWTVAFFLRKMHVAGWEDKYIDTVILQPTEQDQIGLHEAFSQLPQ